MPDDDDAGDDDDSVSQDDDDSVSQDDDDSVLPDDDDSVLPDDDDSVLPDDDDSVLPDDDDSVLPDDDDSVSQDDDDSVLPDDDDSWPDDDDSVLPDDDDFWSDDDDSGPSGPCYSDPYEPNDSMAAAFPLGPTAIWFNVICPTDDDWYSIYATAGARVMVGSDFVLSEGDVALQMYDSSGSLVGASNGTTDHEEISWLNPVDQQVFTRVYLVSDTGSYTGNFYGFGQWLCSVDSWEPNNDAAAAAPLPGPVSEFSLSLCTSTSEDWYLAPLSLGDLLEVRLAFDSTDGDLDLNLYDPGGGLILSGVNETDVETLVHYVTTPGDYAIQVLLAPDALGAGQVYDMDVNFALAPSSCEPDLFEPNEQASSAPAITTTTYEGFTSCPGDDDLFAIDAATGDTIELALDFSHAEGDLDLFLEDAAGAQVASSVSSDDDESLTWPAPSDGTWYARVALTADAGGVPGNLYGLSLSGTTGVCIEDIYEPNNDPATAAPMANGTYRDQTICPGDEDWYELSLGYLEELILDIGYESDEGDVDIFLWDPSLATVLASGTTPDDDEQFSWIVSTTDTYFVQVSLTSDAGSMPGNVYDFGVVSIPSTSCSPDAYEPNDDPSSAWPLPSGSWTGLTVCLGEPDYFTLQLGGPGEIAVDALFDHTEGDLDLHLYDPTGSLLISATSTADDETLAWTATGGGDYLLEVELATDTGPGTGNGYDLVLSVP